MQEILKAVYCVDGAGSGAEALDKASTDPQPDLILLDVGMPGMDGYQVCRALKADPRTADIPVIFLTAHWETEEEQKGLEMGAVDYITKPISIPVLTTRVRTHMQLKAARDSLKERSALLEMEVTRRTHEINLVQDALMVALGSLAETRDNETGYHIRSVQLFIRSLANRLREHPRFRSALTPEEIELLYKSAPLHDIGKVGIRDSILLKPGRLTEEEFESMKTHTTLGRDSIVAAERLLNTPTSFLRVAREIAWTHHERWDGTGYPRGLAGEEIGVAGRLMAVVDVYDALISKRIYKPAYPHETAVAMIRDAAGAHFDPDIVEAFVENAESFRRIAEAYHDGGTRLGRARSPRPA
jgi:putative two-component system response regulator